MKNLDRHKLTLSRSQFGLLNGRCFRQQAGSGRLVLLVLVAFALGLGLATYLFQRGSGSRVPANSAIAVRGSLSVHTSEVLQGLERRWKSGSTRCSILRACLPRFGTLPGGSIRCLTEYAAVAEGKLKVVRYLSPSDAAANAASADRIKPFNLDKGNACFLGLALSCQDRKESIPQLAPEWEQALEPDLTRAILRLANPASSPTRPAGPPAAGCRGDQPGEEPPAGPRFGLGGAGHANPAREGVRNVLPTPPGKCSRACRRHSSDWPRPGTAVPSRISRPRCRQFKRSRPSKLTS